MIMKKLACSYVAAFAVLASSASAQQVMWKNNPISGKVVGLTYRPDSWFLGESQANGYGGHLVTLRSPADRDWILTNFAGSLVGGDGGPWIGFLDHVTEGSWQWASGEPVTFTDWAEFEPSGGVFENEANLGATDGWRWHDLPFGYSVRALIEVPQLPPRSWAWPITYATGASPVYGCAADLDGDGDIDYASPNRIAGTITVYVNNGSGAFTLAQTIAGCGMPLTVVATDWDGDGRMDLIATDSNLVGRVILARGSASGFLAVESMADVPYAHGIALGDLNNDGRKDLVVTSFMSDDRVRVFLRAVNGTIPSSPSQILGPFFDDALEPTIADLDRDGNLDVLVAGANLRLLRGSAVGILSDAGDLGVGRTQHCAVADLNADGVLEILVARRDANTLDVYGETAPGLLSAGNYTRTQQLVTGNTPHWVGIADVDGDGDLDVVVPCYGANTVHVFRNGGGTLTQDHLLWSPGNPLCVAVCDLNGDASPDIVTSNNSSNTLSVVFNQAMMDCNANGIADHLDIASGFATDCNGNGRPDSCDLAFGYSEDSDGDGLLNECEPTLVSLAPNVLPSSVGGTVTVHGTNIPNGIVRLYLNGIPLAFVMTNNVGVVTIPPLAQPSASDVAASGSLGFLNGQGQPEVTGAMPNVFTWDVPEIVAANPANAPFDQSTGVVFTVEDLIATSGVGTATFGNSAPQPATLFSANGVTKIVTIAPAQAQAGPVSVLLRFGNETALENRGFVYLGPSIASISSTQGWQVGGESRTFGLYDFIPGVPVDVHFGGAQVTGTPNGLLASSTLTVSTPFVAAPGVLDLELVQNAGLPNEKRVLSPGAWLAIAPTINTVTPASAYQGGGESVTLNVAGLTPGVSTRVQLGSVSTTGTLVGSLASGSVSITTPLSPIAGAVDVVATQNVGAPNEIATTLVGGFTYVGPAIANLAPTSGPLEGGTNVVVHTSGFEAGVVAQVSAGGFVVAGTVVGSGAGQTVSFQTVLASNSGPSSVTISQGVFTATLANAFTFDAPRIVPYCTAKMTSHGTLPVIGFSGSPSASVNNFAITLSNALPNKTAQFFHGSTSSNFPLFGGTLCVGGSVVRAPMTRTNASSFASAPFNVAGTLVGTTRYFQWWFRDGGDAFGRGLSAGLQVEFYN